MRTPNSQECLYFGRKLSNVETGVEVSLGTPSYRLDTERTYAVIGSDRDDEIYDPVVIDEPDHEMLKERVKIYLPEEGLEIDLEDVLRFAFENCRGIWDRVSK